MGKAIQALATFIGVWFVASLFNGILSGICISVFNSRRFDPQGIIFLSCVLSFVCSIPLVGLVWLVTVIAQAAGKTGYALFQAVLAAALFCGSIGALIFITAFGNEFTEGKFAVGAAIIISAMSGVLVFRKKLRTVA